MEIQTRNTNTLAPLVYKLLLDYGVRSDSRNGPVLRFDEPVTVALAHPRERVNFCPDRDANPFFHYIEACLMLAGIDNNPLLAFFAKQMAQYSDDGLTQNAFYGTRLRRTWGDQLNQIILNLKANPDSRQEVALLWDPADLTKSTKDKACNLMLVFSLDQRGRVKMTSFNRSNDAIWGGVSGANIVHLSLFQEYVACGLEKEVGTWFHTSHNLHVYLGNPKWQTVSGAVHPDPYTAGTVRANIWLWGPMTKREEFDSRLTQLVVDMGRALRSKEIICPDRIGPFNSFIQDGIHLFNAWMIRKTSEARSPLYRQYDEVGQITALDWRYAAYEWIVRHQK